VFLVFYSDCTIYVDPHTIILSFLISCLYFMLFLTDGFVLLCSILTVDIISCFIESIFGSLRVYSAYIIGHNILAGY
jgi:hypothetical protein